MNILFITSYPLEYNTSANIRNLGLIEGLFANGHNVCTYSPYPTNLALFDGALLDFPFDKRFWIGGISNKSTDVTSNFNNGILNKLKRYIYNSYNYLMIYDRRRFLKRYVSIDDFDRNFDIVISSSDPKSAHLFAEKLFKQNSAIAKRWVQYWGDPFSGDISYKRFLGNLRIKREEHRLIRLSDKAVYVSPFTADDMRTKYPDLKPKIYFSPIPYRLSNTPSKMFEFNNNDVILGYMGDYNSSNRNILPLYNVLKNANLQSYIVGNSDLKLRPTENIIVEERLQGERFRRMTEQVNVFVCVCNLGGTQIPGKIYHYINTGKPIMVVVDGEYSDELKRYFDSFNRFYICYNNEESIQECIERIIKERKSFDIPLTLNPKIISDKIIQ